MRGALFSAPASTSSERIIPADAGSTAPWSDAPSSPSDHPRGCGEHMYRPLMSPSSAGSSPRMRGALRLYIWPCAPRQDHPRGCGEHYVIPDGSRLPEGSSPRMRGALNTGNDVSLTDRIIPADAGSTNILPHSTQTELDHPRGCGEHGVGAATNGIGQGSSPRMRGAQSSRSSGSHDCRIIPADAGSTPVLLAFSCGKEDHPRGCGEHVENDLAYFEDQGSSPRMRGALIQHHLNHMESRIIPADAGSTATKVPRHALQRDHPRGCGEHI